MPLRFATAQDTVQDTARPVTVLAPDQVADWCANQPEQTQNWVASTGFAGNIGQAQILPDAQGNPCGAVLGFGSPKQRARGRFALAAGVARLPAGTYRLTQDLPQDSHTEELLGWLLTQYRFDRYRAQPGTDVTLIAPQQADAAGIESLAAAEALTRDLINTPAADMGPVALESAVRDLGAAFGAEVTSVVGEDLLGQNFPMIHAVGRAAHEAPRLVELRWGTTGPALTLVGKGVCFDTGGLNLKPGGSMGLMKKDMGGAANTLGLAHMIMALK
ncbi:MAG: leucyl aminopeptidase family protein, partial [Primorskyibacter sp.]